MPNIRGNEVMEELVFLAPPRIEPVEGQEFALSTKRAGIKIGNFSSTAAGNGIRIKSTRTGAVKIYGDDAGTVLWAAGSVPDLKTTQSRLMITTDQTGGHIRAFGLMGQLKSYDGKWNTEQVGAVYARLEIVRSAETLTLGDYGVSAGVAATVATSGTITISSRHILAGVAAISDFRATLTQTGKSVAFYAGKYDETNWSDSTARTVWGYGLYIEPLAVITAISVGSKANTAGSGVVIPSTDDFGAVRIFTDDNGANIADSVRGLQSRTLLTIDQSAGSIRAMQGQLKLLNNIDVATGIYTAVQAYLELAGTHISSAGATLSCLDASLEITTTLTATGEVFGIHCEATGAGAFAGSGTCAGIGITTGGTPIWPVGLYIAPLAVTTAISVGTKANLKGSGVIIPSTDDWGCVRVFTDDNGANVADSVRGIQSRTLLTTSQSAGTIRALQGQFKVLTGVNFDTGVYAAVQGYIELAGTHTVSAAGILACFDASIEIGTALTATGYVAGFKAELTGAGTCAAGLDCGFLVTNAAGAAVWTYGLYVEATAADIGIYMPGCATKALEAVVTAVAADGSAVKITATQTAGKNESGIAGYFDANFGGVMTATYLYGFGTWINLATSFDGAAVYGVVAAQDNGIYATTLTESATTDLVYGMRAECITGATVHGLYAFSLNAPVATTASHRAIFYSDNAESVGHSETERTTKAGSLAIAYINGSGRTEVYYVNLFIA